MARKLTLPLAPCVTAVTFGVPSKLSAEPPPTPVMALNTIAVSSLVVTLSATMSATALTVIVTVSMSVSAPPLLVTVIVSVPL